MKKLLLLAIAALILSACSDDNNNTPKTYTVTVNVTFVEDYLAEDEELVKGEFDDQSVSLGMTGEQGGKIETKRNTSENPSTFIFKDVEAGKHYKWIYIRGSLKNGGIYDRQFNADITIDKDIVLDYKVGKH